MAKQAQINISINTQNAIKSIGDLNNEINGTVVTINDLKMTVEALQQELESTEYGTERFNELKSALIEANTQLKNYELSIEALDNEQLAAELKSVAGGFMDIAGGLTLIGVSGESMEKITQTFAKVEGATKAVTGAIELYSSGMKVANTIIVRAAAMHGALAAAQTQGAAATQGSTIAMKALNLVMKANPIMLLVTGIGLLVGALAMFSSASDDAGESAEEQAEKFERLNRAYEQNIKLAERRYNERVLESEIRNTSKLLDLKQELLFAEDKLTDLQRDRPEDLNAQYAQLQKIEEIRGRIVAERINEIDAFDELAKLEDERYAEVNKALKEIDIPEKDADNYQQVVDRYRELSEEQDRLFDLQLTRAKRRDLLIKELYLSGDEFAVESENRLADFRKKIEDERLENLKKLTDQERGLFWELNTDKALKIKDTYNQEVKEAENAFNRVKELSKKGSADRLAAEQAYNDAVKLARLKMERDLAALLIEERKNNTIRLETEILQIRKNLLTAQGLSATLYYIQLYQKQKELLLLQMENELSITTLTEEEKLKIKAEYALKIAELDKEFRDRTLKEEEKEVETLATRLQKMAQMWLDFYDKISSTVQETLNTIQMAFDLAFDNQTRKIEESYSAQVEAAKDAYGEQLISREEYENQIEQIENQKAQKERALRKKQFDQQKAFNVVNAVMNGAQAVLQALASMPPPLSYVMAAINAALAGVQIGLISSQKFTAARGGVVPGAGPSSVDSVDAKLAPGEMVINANSASMFPTLLSEINKAGGGIPLAPEPVSTAPGGNNIYAPSQSVVRAYVVESELSSTSRRVRRMEDAASF